MPLRAEVVRRKLLEIEEAVGQLREWLPVTVDAMRQDRKLQWAVQHELLIAAESVAGFRNILVHEDAEIDLGSGARPVPSAVPPSLRQSEHRVRYAQCMRASGYIEIEEPR